MSNGATDQRRRTILRALRADEPGAPRDQTVEVEEGQSRRDLIRSTLRKSAEQEAEPNPTFGFLDPPEITASESFTNELQRGLINSAETVAPFLFGSGRLSELKQNIEIQQQGTGFSGEMGAIVGNLPATLIPLGATLGGARVTAGAVGFGRLPQFGRAFAGSSAAAAQQRASAVLPLTSVAFGSTAAGEQILDNDSVVAAVGAALAEGSSEFLGLAVEQRLLRGVAEGAGRAILADNPKRAARILDAGTAGIKGLGLGPVEGVEEVASQLGQELSQVVGGVKTAEEGFRDFTRNAGRTFRIGTGVGLLAGGGIAGASSLARSQPPPQPTPQPVSINTQKLLDGLNIETSTFLQPTDPSQVDEAGTGEPIVVQPRETDPSLASQSVPTYLTPMDQRLEMLVVPEQVEGEVQAGEVPEPEAQQRQQPAQLETEAQINLGTTQDFLSRLNLTIRQAEQAKGKEATRIRRQAIDQVRGRLRSIRAQNQSQRRQVNQLVRELRQVIQRTVPRNRQDRMLRFLEEVGRKASPEAASRAFDRAMDRVAEEVDRADQEEAALELKNEIEQTNPRDIENQALRETVEDIANSVQFTRPNRDTVRRLESRIEFIQQNPDAVLPQRALRELDRLAKEEADQFSADTLRQMADQIRRIRQANKKKKRIKLRRRELDLDATRQQMAEEADRPGMPLSRRRTRDRSGRQVPDKVNLFESTRRVSLGLPENLQLETMTEWISGATDSTTKRVLYTQVDEAYTEYHRGRFEDNDAIIDTLGSLGFSMEEMASMSNQFAQVENYLKQLINRDFGVSEATTESHRLDSGQTLEITPDERNGILAALRDADYYDQVIFGVRTGGARRKVGLAIPSRPGETFTLTQNDVARMRSSVTAREQQLIDAVVDRMNGPMKEKLKAWSLDQLGRDITKSDTFFPTLRERPSGEVQADPRAGNFDSEPQLESQSIVQRRSRSATPFRIRGLMETFFDYSSRVNGISNLGPAIKQARQAIGIVSNEERQRGSPDPGPFSDLLDRAKVGQRVRNRLEAVYDLTVEEFIGGRKTAGPIERFARGFGQISRGLLGLNPRVALYQIGSQFAAMSEIPEGFMAQQLAEGAPFRTSLDEKVRRSPQLRARMEGSSMHLVMEGAGGTGRAAGDDGAFFMIRAMDAAAVRGIYRAAEIMGESEGLSGQELDDFALNVTERTVKRTQPTFDPLHLSATAVEARRNRIAKMLTFFRSQRAKNVDIVARSLIRFRDGEASAFTVAGAMTKVILAQSAYLMAVKSLFDFLVGDDDELGNPKNYAKQLVDLSAGNVIFGNYMAAIANSIAFPSQRIFTPSFSPVNSLMTGLFESGRGVMANTRDVLQGGTREDRMTLFRSAASFGASLGALVGVPLSFMIRETEDVISNRIMDDEKAKGPTILQVR